MLEMYKTLSHSDEMILLFLFQLQTIKLHTDDDTVFFMYFYIFTDELCI